MPRSKMLTMEGLAAYGAMLAVARTEPFAHAENAAALKRVQDLIHREWELVRAARVGREGDGCYYSPAYGTR